MGRSYTVDLSDAEAAQLDKLATFEERDPAAILRAFILDGLARRRERRLEIETETGGRPKRPKPTA